MVFWQEVLRHVPPSDVVIMVDGSDVLPQRNLSMLYDEFVSIAHERSVSAKQMVAVLGEANCWPWPKPTEMRRNGFYSRNYWRNTNVSLSNGSTFPADRVCHWFRSASSGDWPWPNSGIMMGHVSALHKLAGAVRSLPP